MNLENKIETQRKRMECRKLSVVKGVDLIAIFLYGLFIKFNFVI